jgi:ABC-type uncharacterized transport system substrate-binding protein
VASVRTDRPGRPAVRTLISAAAAPLLVIGATATATAHPHVFIEHTVTLVMKDKELAALRFSWVFDEMFSATLRTNFVKGKPDKLSKETIAEIEQRAFANLAQFGYFIDLKINNEPTKVTKVAGFDVTFAGTRAVYQFTVPLDALKPQARTVLEVAIFDPEYYVDYRFSRARPYGIEPAEGTSVDCTFARDVPRQTEGWGTIGVDVVTCSYNR